MTKINIELYSCAGGMAEGFRRAGITFDIAIDMSPDHCASYEMNLKHRPLCMDTRDFLAMLKQGARFDVRLLVADPPCTPWSHAGKRKGEADPRDMLAVTCEIIALLRPDAYLIGNVPGLDDGANLHVVQRVIGGLSKHGYCTADFARLNASSFGVPQHRIRPFWFGHRHAPCIQWPEPTHGDPDVHASDQLMLSCVTPLLPWVSCEAALVELPVADWGRPVKLRRRETEKSPVGTVTITADHAMSKRSKPARTITRNTHGDGSILVNDKHPPTNAGGVSPTLGAKERGQGGQVLVLNAKHAPTPAGSPISTIRSGGEGHSAPNTVIAITKGHTGSASGEPAKAVLAGDGGGTRRVIRLEGDGQGQCVGDPGAPAPTITTNNEAAVVATKRGRKRDVGRVAQGNRTGDPAAPSATVTSKVPRVGAGESQVLNWPWSRPATTTVQADDRLAPPGHHDEHFATRSLPDAVVINEKVGAILQGFPPGWIFVGKSKKARWGAIGMAMPPPMAHAVATSIVRQWKEAIKQRPCSHMQGCRNGDHDRECVVGDALAEYDRRMATIEAAS